MSNIAIFLSIFVISVIRTVRVTTIQSMYEEGRRGVYLCENSLARSQELLCMSILECGVECLKRNCLSFPAEITNANISDGQIWMTSGLIPSKALITGPDHAIPDSQLSASSVHQPDHDTHCSRLGVPLPVSCFSASWSASVGAGPGEWIQADLGARFIITSVATGGRGMDNGGAYTGQRVTSYKLATLCEDGSVEYNIQGINEKIFSGNIAERTTITNKLEPAMIARFVRLYPQTWEQHMSLRWELYGR